MATITETNETTKNLVVYHNSLSELALKDFNAKERDLLMALCSRLKDRGTEDFKISFKEIRKLANYKQTSNKVLGEDLDSMTDKLFSLGMKEYGENGEIRKFVFFQGFDIYPEKGELDISVGKRFTYLINELGANFTSFELEEHTSLRSSYSKECYRQIMRYKDKGEWWVYADRFKELLNLPDGYRDRDIKTKVIPIIEEELSKLFDVFEVSIESRSGVPYKYTFRFNRYGFGEEEPKNEQEPTEREPEEKQDSPQKELIEERFNEFWKAYPNKKGKGAARKKWEKIKPDEDLFATIMNAVEKQKLTTNWTKNNGQFIPHPTTWLNQERWEDEVDNDQQVSLPNNTQDFLKRAREMRERKDNYDNTQNE